MTLIRLPIPLRHILRCMVLLALCSSCARLGVPLPRIEERKPPVGIYHTVRSGETLWRICKAYNAGIQDVAELNNIQDPSKIKAGDRIFIPGATKALQLYPVAPAGRAVREPEPRIVRETGLFCWPVQGRVVQEYGITQNQKNDGISIQAPAGAPVVAAAAGTVAFADFLRGYGNTIIINHSDRFVTVYAQVHKISVRQGQHVRQNEKIAQVAAAQADGLPQLHFQIRKDNKPRNPMFYLPR